MKLINTSLLNQMLLESYINVQKHPDAELYIYNYSANVQYEKLWNEITLACRGLILDKEKNIVARPFQKFFNLGEVDDINLPASNFNAYEKMDGSLGILYWLNDKPYIATRGSFTSDQAIKGTEILHSKYQLVISKLDKTKTYLFEIIYPENRIVVDYGTTEDLILLAIIDTQTGNNEALQNIGFTMVNKYDGVKDIHLLKKLEEENKEGFVVQYENGFRVKVKFDEYLRLHKIVTMVSNITVWEYLMNELPFDELLDKVPDEFYTWVKDTKNNLTQQFEIIENECKQNFKTFDTEKETAIYFMSCNHSKVLFSMWKNRNYKPLIWKMIRPTFSKPFQNMEEQLLKKMQKKNNKLLMLVGSPGSGKSTYSKELMKSEKKWVRVSRDDYRAMQFQETEGNINTEHALTLAIEASVEAFLNRGFNIIIDATHCKKEYINQYVKRFGYVADIHFKVFDVPLEELEKRCAEREAQTGKHIPKNVIQKYVTELENLKKHFDFAPILKKPLELIVPIQDENKPSCFLFDLDGTLANANGRNMFNPTAEEVMNDLPIKTTIKVLQSLKNHHEIIFVSGREANNYEATKNWLIKYVFNNEDQNINLFMRPEGDYRRDSIIKSELLHQHIFPSYNVLGAFDDRLQVIRECWNKEGIFCFNVNQFLEEF